MKLLNFIVWLSAGAVIGWFAQWMVKTEQRRIRQPVPVKESGSEKS